jgi:hypothetical protein
VADGRDVEVEVEPSKVPPDAGEGLVGGDDLVTLEDVTREIGAQHVDLAAAALGDDPLLVTTKGERVVGDLDGEVLGHLVVVDDDADAQGDLTVAAQRLARPRDQKRIDRRGSLAPSHHAVSRGGLQQDVFNVFLAVRTRLKLTH